MCNYTSIFCELPHTYRFHCDLQSREVLSVIQMKLWYRCWFVSCLEHMLNLCDVNLIYLTYYFLSKYGVKYWPTFGCCGQENIPRWNILLCAKCTGRCLPANLDCFQLCTL